MRCQHKRYTSDREWCGAIRNRVNIGERAEIVEQKIRVGDQEGNTVVDKNYQEHLLHWQRENRAISIRPATNQACR